MAVGEAMGRGGLPRREERREGGWVYLASSRLKKQQKESPWGGRGGDRPLCLRWSGKEAADHIPGGRSRVGGAGPSAAGGAAVAVGWCGGEGISPGCPAIKMAPPAIFPSFIISKIIPAARLAASCPTIPCDGPRACRHPERHRRVPAPGTSQVGAGGGGEAAGGVKCTEGEIWPLSWQTILLRDSNPGAAASRSARYQLGCAANQYGFLAF